MTRPPVRSKYSRVVDELATPSFLAWHPVLPALYAVSGHGDVVSAFQILPDGDLLLMGRQPTGGVLPAHVAVHGDGRYLFVANYGDGTLAVHSVQPDGALGKLRQLVRHHGSGPRTDRQSEPHVHCSTVCPRGDHLLAAISGPTR